MEDDKSLIPKENLPPALGSEIPGLGDFPDSSVQVPRLIIGQPNNLSGYPEGKFINNLTQETFDKLSVVLLQFRRSRTLWPKGIPKKGDEPLCKSQDAKKADNDYLGRLCPRCDGEHDLCVDEKEQPTCTHAKFADDYRPECRLGYHLLLLAHPSADVFILTVTGKGISPTNRLLSNFKVKGRPTYSASFSITLEKSNDGNYYIIRYGDFKWLENPAELQSLFDRFKFVQMIPTKEEDHSAVTD